MKTMMKGEGQCLGKKIGTDGVAFSFLLEYIASVNQVFPFIRGTGKTLKRSRMTGDTVYLLPLFFLNRFFSKQIKK